jgi:hypothetical protein
VFHEKVCDCDIERVWIETVLSVIGSFSVSFNCFAEETALPCWICFSNVFIGLAMLCRQCFMFATREIPGRDFILAFYEARDRRPFFGILLHKRTIHSDALARATTDKWNWKEKRQRIMGNVH